MQQEQIEQTFRYRLPAQIPQVISVGYCSGLLALPNMVFAKLSPGAPLPNALLPNMPREQEKIEGMARVVSTMLLSSSDEQQPVTNNPALFRQHYETGFVSGYRFGLFALSRGLMAVLYPLTPEQRSLLVMHFAWERFVKEGAPEPGPTISQALYQLQALYKQYHALN